MNTIERLLSVSSPDPDDSRRRRLLNILLAGVWGMTFLAMLSELVRRIAGIQSDGTPSFLLAALMILMAGILVIYFINRHWSGKVASWLFLALLTGVMALSDTPFEIARGRSLFLFAIPILVSSVVLPSSSTFAMAGLISVLIGAIAVDAGLRPDAITTIGFLTVALISWLSARSLEQALGDLRSANRTLGESEARYRTLFSNASDAILIHAPSGAILEANEVALSSLGYGREELVQRNVADIELAGGGTSMAERVKNLQLGGTLLCETVYRRHDGAGIPVEVNSQLIEYGYRPAVLNIARNISERKRMEELQERVQEHARLAAVGELAAGMAHDFNNLLAGIMGLADLQLMNPDLPPAVLADLHHITQQAQSGAHLIRQILDFARRSPSLEQNLDLERFLHEALSILNRTIPENIRLTLEEEPGDYAIKGDPIKIQQALVNLVVNAKDAMPDGGKIMVRLAKAKVAQGGQPPLPDLSPGEWVSLAVSDTGTGIPADVRARMFEPFFTTKAPGKGTGLGLAQVYGIVCQHQGQIGVETKLGSGTTFTIYLPAIPSAPEYQVSAGEEEIAWGQGETILVVEDEYVVLETTKALLASLGYHVLTATNGSEALEVSGRHQGEVSLVLSDVVMPEMGAEELCRQLKKRQAPAKMAVMSGYLSADTMAALRSAGIEDWLQKPFSAEGLARTVRQALDRP